MRIIKIKQLLFSIVLIFTHQSAVANFTAFESGQVRPIAQSPDGQKLFVVNTPDNQLEIFDVNNGSPTYAESVSVGLEPVSVAAYSNDQVWVVNYLSDSISIIDVSTSHARVVKTLLVGDEPADIVFAGTGGDRALISTAHRGQIRGDIAPLDNGTPAFNGIFDTGDMVLIQRKLFDSSVNF